jgi:hypothetical protein
MCIGIRVRRVRHHGAGDQGPTSAGWITVEVVAS